MILKVNRTNQLKKFLLELLCEYSENVYYGQAISKSKYPRIEFSIKQIFTDEQYLKYLLTLNFYDKSTCENIDSIADDICDKLGLSIYAENDFYVKFLRQDDRQMIDEQDKTLQHVMTTFEVRYFLRRDYK